MAIRRSETPPCPPRCARALFSLLILAATSAIVAPDPPSQASTNCHTRSVGIPQEVEAVLVSAIFLGNEDGLLQIIEHAASAGALVDVYVSDGARLAQVVPRSRNPSLPPSPRLLVKSLEVKGLRTPAVRCTLVQVRNSLNFGLFSPPLLPSLLFFCLGGNACHFVLGMLADTRPQAGENLYPTCEFGL